MKMKEGSFKTETLTLRGGPGRGFDTESPGHSQGSGGFLGFAGTETPISPIADH